MKCLKISLLILISTGTLATAQQHGPGQDDERLKRQPRTSSEGRSESRNVSLPVARVPAPKDRQTKTSPFKSYTGPTNKADGHMPVRTHADSLGNRVTSDHLNRIDFSRSRSQSIMHDDLQVRETVYHGNSQFNQAYKPRLDHRAESVRSFYVHHPVIIEQRFAPFWNDHLFHGGYYWGFHPVADITVFFYDPMIYWMFVPTHDAHYYQTWYGVDYSTYPSLQYPFLYHGIYFPTDNLKQLLQGVSGMPVDRQVQFRAAITEFTKKAVQVLADVTHHHVKMSTGDIIITHYEIFGLDESVAIEGSIGQNEEQYEFKGLLDLQEPLHSSIFIPESLSADPAHQSTQQLDEMNVQIKKIQGNPEKVPIEKEEPATPAEISADPS